MPLASSADLQPQQSDYLLAQCKFILDAFIDTQPHSSLESLQTLCQFRWGFLLLPFPPAPSSARASSERCLALSHTSRAGIRSGSLSLFFVGISLAATGPLEMIAKSSPLSCFSQPFIAPVTTPSQRHLLGRFHSRQWSLTPCEKNSPPCPVPAGDSLPQMPGPAHLHLLRVVLAGTHANGLSAPESFPQAFCENFQSDL